MEILNYINEVWKPIRGYVGLYEVSNFGRVKSLKRKCSTKWGVRTVPEKILKPNIVNGYYQVSLKKEGNAKMFLVHRLVAEAFIPNPNNYPCINHRNEIKSENWVELDDDGNIVGTNLEWCTKHYNNTYGTHYQRSSITLTNRPDLSKPVLQYTIDGTLIGEYPSGAEAARATGVCKTHIRNCCGGKEAKAGGFRWKYK